MKRIPFNSREGGLWSRGFSVSHIRALIVCRGPIRKEAMDIFSSLGVEYGILLSERDSIIYRLALAPELRLIRNRERVHPIKDYSGASQAEREERIVDILAIARQYGYTHIFAGYGFMAEDAGFVEQIEAAGISFIGPSSTVHRLAGAKDSAKKIARKIGVSVTPGLDNISSVTLLKKAGGEIGALERMARSKGLQLAQAPQEPLALAAELLQEGYRSRVGLISMEELQKEARYQAEQIFKAHKGSRIRLKHIGGGGGKGQRIVHSAEQIPEAVFEMLSEIKATADADNKNFLMELNIEETRHNEIQLLGNGDWCIALGGRDCSLQMHEQKLVELAITEELFRHEIEAEKRAGRKGIAKTLEADRRLLKEMERQAENFGKAVGLDSVSTFEAIVSGESFFFMEMNTRIQVEHSVTEMVYCLRFANPEDQGDFFDVHSLLHGMLLISLYGRQLPLPHRIAKKRAGGEVRLNAQNAALQPSAGGIIEYWSMPLESELRDDQGIGAPNPDTGEFVRYHLAGAYDSNIALVITDGESRRENLERLAEILRQMKIYGEEVSTNQSFLYGILQFCIGLHPMLKPNTRFVIPYLASVGSFFIEMRQFDLDFAQGLIHRKIIDHYGLSPKDIKAKETLLLRPLRLLLQDAHLAAGWLMRNHRRAFDIKKGDRTEAAIANGKRGARADDKADGEADDKAEASLQVVWRRNPLEIIKDLYYFLCLEDYDRPGASPIEQIWPEDRRLLEKGICLYESLHGGAAQESRQEGAAQESLQGGAEAASADSVASAGDLQAFHQDWQGEIALLALFILLGHRSGMLDYSIDDHLRPQIPERFQVEGEQKRFLATLIPPAPRSAETIVAASGGNFYSQETPDTPPYLQAGSRFEVGDPIYIIEVMKMFNKVYAQFSGSVTEVLVEGGQGQVVKRGQPLFRVKADQEIEVESPEEQRQKRESFTEELLASLRFPC